MHVGGGEGQDAQRRESHAQIGQRGVGRNIAGREAARRQIWRAKELGQPHPRAGLHQLGARQLSVQVINCPVSLCNKQHTACIPEISSGDILQSRMRCAEADLRLRPGEAAVRKPCDITGRADMPIQECIP